LRERGLQGCLHESDRSTRLRAAQHLRKRHLRPESRRGCVHGGQRVSKRLL
jgi:hypothetical protein